MDIYNRVAAQGTQKRLIRFAVLLEQPFFMEERDRLQRLAEAHLVGQDALLDCLLDDGVVIERRPLHFVS